MSDSMQTKVDGLCLLARALAESLSSLSEECADPAEWRVRIAAGHAHAIEDLLIGLAGFAPRESGEAPIPASRSDRGAGHESSLSSCALPQR